MTDHIRTRLKPDDRKQQLLNTGLSIVRKSGVRALTRQALAEKAGVTDGLINRYFGRRNDMRRIVLEQGIYINKDGTVLRRALEAGIEVPDIPKEIAHVAAAG